MSLTVSQGEETMVITTTSDPKSKWPALCPILSSLCNGPVCFASEDMKEKLTDTQRITRLVQTVVAVMNLVMGCIGLIFYTATTSVSMVLPVLQLCVVISFCILTIKSLGKKSGSAKLVDKTTSVSRSGIRQYLLMFSSWFNRSCSMTLASPEDMKDKLTEVHTALGTVQIMIGVMNIAMGCFGFIFSFWIGAVFILVGIMCVVAVKICHPKLLVIAVILNVVSSALAITAAVLYSMDLAMGSNLSCYKEQYYYSPYNDMRTHEKSSFQSCFYYKNLNEMILGGLDIMMTALSVLQLCVSISFCVLTGEALCKSVEDPELHVPLLEDDTADDA